MENIKNIGEQPNHEATLTAAADVENESTGLREGSPLGKFKSSESLLSSYNALQVEFTKKCQQLSELTKQKNDNANTPFFETDGWQQKLDDFFTKNPKAKEFSKEIANVIVGDKEIANGKSPLEMAYAVVLENNYTSLLNNVNNDEFLLEKLSKTAKETILNNYLKELNNSPFLMTGTKGNVVATGCNAPKNVYEAGEMAKKMFK